MSQQFAAVWRWLRDVGPTPGEREREDRLVIGVRAFAPPQPKPGVSGGLGVEHERPFGRRRGLGRALGDLFIAAQRLRIAAYQFRKGDDSDEAGLLYDPRRTRKRARPAAL
jgi:hypothetical protein